MAIISAEEIAQLTSGHSYIPNGKFAFLWYGIKRNELYYFLVIYDNVIYRFDYHNTTKRVAYCYEHTYLTIQELMAKGWKAPTPNVAKFFKKIMYAIRKKIIAISLI